MRRTSFLAVGLVVLAIALGPAAPGWARHDGPVFHQPHSLTPLRAKMLLFTARDRSHGIELWKTAGTGASTRIVKPIRTGLENYGYQQPEQIGELVPWNGYMYYARNSTVDEGAKLWRTDGTDAGTRIVKDTPKPDPYWRPSYLTIFDDSIFFIAPSTSGSGDELWKTDGTGRGTVVVSDADGSHIRQLLRVGRQLFFTTEDWDTGEEALWKTDGTGPGTERVATIILGTPGMYSCSLVGRLYQAGGLIYFPVAEGPPGGDECNEDLWRSDGTSAGTFKLRDDDLPQWGSHRVYDLDGRAVYVGNDPEHSRELWTSDGTPEGTVMIEDINPGPKPSQASAVSHGHYSVDPVLGDQLYFDANDGEHGSEVWVTDGTAGGTKLLAEIATGTKGGHPHNFQAVEPMGLMFFIADDGRHGYELWKTDGTAAGTKMVKDVNPSGDGLEPEYVGGDLTRLRDHLYFFATDGEHPPELWRTDGTSRETKRVAAL